MGARVRERLAVSKQAAQKFNVKGLNLKKLSDLEVRKLYQIEISNRFAALGNLNDREDINRAWENTISKLGLIRVFGLYEMQQHKPRVYEEYLRFLDQRKQAKMQWVQDPNQRKYRLSKQWKT